MNNASKIEVPVSNRTAGLGRDKQAISDMKSYLGDPPKSTLGRHDINILALICSTFSTKTRLGEHMNGSNASAA